MSTLKLNKSPATTDQKKQKPVRPLAPELRDRSKAPMLKKDKPSEAAPQSTEQAPRSKAHSPRSESGSKSRDSRKPAGKPGTAGGRSSAARTGRSDKPRDHDRSFAAKRESRPAARPAVQSAPSVADNDQQPRLSKVMADRGLCSRREADDWIANGWVKVNGEIIETLGTRIDADADIVISAYAREHQAETVTVLLHKPVGYVSGQAEDGYEPAVVLFNPDNQWAEDASGIGFKRGHLRGLAPAGRLDIDSTGLLVLTQDGRVARKLIGDDSNVEKEYLVRVEGQLIDNGLALLNHGLSLDGVTLKPAKVSWQNEEQLRFVLREGRKRQIRRMCELVGLHVVGLKRIRIGSINLGKLPPGQWRYLAEHERF
ncbi:pseudouridine synthase [Methylophilus medardicus]|uniref:Dual-specificity RNA pseudouridine synthase RluF n=1 Tax=Methylophilus medardicus TaxID=2588534 RepID=A0A5B8CVU1_9PROT|nr:pseudouridine synthase [Methylophilus medardicus]QDC45190.1 pseudouridine synthase [Methylophilus medardicus]QDC50197.1 pseudouridine synthase [Methylophilus medardicus]QDC53902.1 pseudouridine synthase [Methylophilus medardicus]